jgi:hypothetical protein
MPSLRETLPKKQDGNTIMFMMIMIILLIDDDGSDDGSDDGYVVENKVYVILRVALL